MQEAVDDGGGGYEGEAAEDEEGEEEDAGAAAASVVRLGDAEGAEEGASEGFEEVHGLWYVANPAGWMGIQWVSRGALLRVRAGATLVSDVLEGDLRYGNRRCYTVC